MEFHVFAVVLAAAALHASWNAFVKGTDDKLIAMSAMVLGHQPFALVAIALSPVPHASALPFLFGGAACHVGYQLFLAMAYRGGDLSQVYPIARGFAPIVVTLMSLLWLPVTLSWLELASIGCIAAGILGLALARDEAGKRNIRAAALALLTGCFIAGYSLLDGLGARAAGTALGFWGWLSIVNGIAFFALLEFVRPGVGRQVVVAHKKTAVGVGGVSFVAFALVIWAFTQAPIALVTALRESSIVIAVAIGMVAFGERRDAVRLASIAVAVAGIALLRVSGL